VPLPVNHDRNVIGEADERSLTEDLHCTFTPYSAHIHSAVHRAAQIPGSALAIALHAFRE